MSEFNGTLTDIEKASPRNPQAALRYEDSRHIEDARGPSPITLSPHRVFASGTPLGLLSFATTTFILGMYYVHTRGIHVVNVVVGMTIAVGGIVQFAAGMWELYVTLQLYLRWFSR
ncbi:hypothetical protein FRC02_003803 [Tulasnella sp. 418]|nr:hypothetical protein FRC02_003803 [Tulasnella sp. 418]